MASGILNLSARAFIFSSIVMPPEVVTLDEVTSSETDFSTTSVFNSEASSFSSALESITFVSATGSDFSVVAFFGSSFFTVLVVVGAGTAMSSSIPNSSSSRRAWSRLTRSAFRPSVGRSLSASAARSSDTVWMNN